MAIGYLKGYLKGCLRGVLRVMMGGNERVDDARLKHKQSDVDDAFGLEALGGKELDADVALARISGVRIDGFG